MAECFRNLEKAMKVRSAVPYALSLRGAAYLLQGRIPEALPELQKAVQLLPISINYSNLGYAHIVSGEIEEGEAEVRRAVRLQDSSPQAQLLMGLLLLNRKPQIAEACEHLEKARVLARAVGIALAVCYVRDGREDAAIRQIRDLLGPVDQSKFEFWKKWTADVAVRRMPSAAFGLRMAPKP